MRREHEGVGQRLRRGMQRCASERTELQRPVLPGRAVSNCRVLHPFQAQPAGRSPPASLLFFRLAFRRRPTLGDSFIFMLTSFDLGFPARAVRCINEPLRVQPKIPAEPARKNSVSVAGPHRSPEIAFHDFAEKRRTTPVFVFDSVSPPWPP